MATSGAVNTKVLDDTYFWVRWNVQKSSSSTNSTTINWSCGVNPGHQYYTNALKIGPIKINETTVYDGGTFPNITDYQEYTLSSGTLTIEHNSNGTKTFTISPFYGWIYESGNTWSSEKSFELPSLTLYTNCTGPTKIAFTLNGSPVVKNKEYYLIPGDEIIVTWEGQTNGTNNPITGYDVYYYFSNDNSRPTTTVYSDIYSTTKSSLTITITSKRRGTYLSVGIVTKSKYNTTNLVSSSSDYKLMVNVRPNKPSVSKSSFIYKSTQTSTTIKTISPGKLNFGSQTGEVRYATTITGAKKTIVDGQLPGAEEGTYYFWTYDGKELSNDHTTVKVTENIKPHINCSMTCTKTSTIKNNSNFNENKYKCVEEIYFTIKGNKQGYYDLVVKDDEKEIILIKKGAFSTSEIKTPTYKVRELDLTLNSNISFLARSYDSLEEGNTWEKTNESFGGKTYAFYNPSLPFYIDTYNQFDNSNIPNTTSGNFYQKIRVRFSYDSYFLEKGSVKLNQGTDYLQGSYTVKKDNNENPAYIICDFTASGNLAPGKTYYLSFIKQLFSQTSSDTISYTRVPTFNPTPSLGSAFLVKPFTSGATTTYQQDLKIQKPYNSETFYTYYNIDSTKNNWWKSELIVDGKIIDLTKFLIPGLVFETNGDYAIKKFEITKGDSSFFNEVAKIITIPNRKGEITATLKNTIKNCFGQEFSGQASIATLNFNEEPIINFTDINSAHYLFEGYTISTTCNIKTYSPNAITFQLLLKKKDEPIIVYDSKKTENIVAENPPGFNNPREISLSINKIISEIKDSKDCWFSAKVLDGKSVIKTYNYNKGNSYKRLRHTAPTISFDKAVYSEESEKGIITVDYNISDIGTITSNESSYGTVTTTLTLTLEIDGTSYTANSSVEGQGKGTAIFNLDKLKITDFKNGHLNLKTTVVYTGSNIDPYNKSKIGISNTYTIYGIAPTIAYRKNSIGINTASLGESDILTISPTSNRNLITFNKKGDSTEKLYVDLATGRLIGFIIDCGEIK